MNDVFAESVTQAAKKLAQEGPKALHSRRMNRTQPRKVGRRTKEHQVQRALQQMSPAQRREHSADLERKAKRRFEVAIGLRVNTTPPKVVEKSDASSAIDAMFSSDPSKNPYFKPSAVAEAPATESESSDGAVS